MSDTHQKTERRYVVVETVIDCDGSCVEGTGARQESTVQWDGLPRALVEAVTMSQGDFDTLSRWQREERLTRKDDAGRYIVNP